MGEDKRGTNVIEGQRGLPVTSTVQKCCMVIHGVCVCVCVLDVCVCVFSPEEINLPC